MSIDGPPVEPVTPDYYADLDISVTATTGEIKKAWRQGVLRWHPDKTGNGGSTNAEELVVRN